MHELSLCRSIELIVEQSRDGRDVRRVNLLLGQLRQVVPETLRYCWALVTEDGPLAGSELVIDHVPVRLDCRDCGRRTEVAHVLVLTCADCGSGQIDLVSGEEFMITSLDLAPAAPASPEGSRIPADHPDSPPPTEEH